MSLQDDASYYAFAAGWKIVRRLPEKTAYRNFNRVADRLWAKRGGGVLQLEQNLRRVVPTATDAEIRELSKQSMRNYFRYWCDAFRMPDWSQERIVSSVVCYNEHYIDEALALNAGIICALPHMGNWDHIGAWGTVELAPVTSVAERLKPEKLFDKFIEYRTSIGLRIYPLGQPNVVDTLADELRDDKRIIALLSDRDLTAHGIAVDFFGEKTRMPAGPANLALRTGAPILPASLWYDGPNCCINIHPPVVVPAGAPTGDDARNQPGYAAAVSDMTQQIANAFQDGIAAHPADWHMMQKLWLSDLDQDRLAAADAAGGRTAGE